uniref:diacylglycerol kinase theta isoform X2 n=1 Tax=Myxine glutinosa TaxID=7769 RepID=UPI00358F13CE
MANKAAVDEGDGSGNGSKDRTSSPTLARTRAGGSLGNQAGGSLGKQARCAHTFRKLTLTKPSYCHHCTDFIWGIIGHQCDVCNFLSHEKCLRYVVSPCSPQLPSTIKAPVAHCFISFGVYKKRFCQICRKLLEESFACRCEVCEMHLHVECLRFASSDCRKCHQEHHTEQVLSVHHWQEGNLPAGSRCESCRKTCASHEVLCSQRCLWCHVTAHSSCCASISDCCSFGRLEGIMLPPFCVTLQRPFTLQDILLDPDGARDQSEVAASDAPSSISESGKQTLKIFDGDDAIRSGQFRYISVPRICKEGEVVEAALREYHLSSKAENYELHSFLQDAVITSEEGDPYSNGHPQESGAPGDATGTIRQPFGDVASEAYTIRCKALDSEVLKIYTDWLCKGVAYLSICVDQRSTVQAVVEQVLQQLGRQSVRQNDYGLMVVVMNSQRVHRTLLNGNTLLLEYLQQCHKASVQAMNLTRFYVVLQHQDATEADLLVLGFPPGLSASDYLSQLSKHVCLNENASVKDLYSKQGALPISFNSAEEAKHVFSNLRDSVVTVEGRQLHAVVLPSIEMKLLPDGCQPLVVLVNPRSGGLQGRELLHSFRRLLNPHQVFDLSLGGPLPSLHVFRSVPGFRILVCGGDGTVGWVLSTLEEIKGGLACVDPPVAILPLGTGNDLARVLRWGPGYTGEDPSSILNAVQEADVVHMDRWTVLLDSQFVEQAEGNSAVPQIVQMNNYLGIGVDADLSLCFHNAREEEPAKFNSRFHNKGVYLKVGLQKMSSSRSLHRDIKIQVDGVDIDLPGIEGLILLNIPSWGSGADLWGSESDSSYEKPRMDDGKLEVVGVTGVMHMGQVQSRLRSGIRIAQGTFIRLTLHREVAMQVDGEPWTQPPGTVIVSLTGTKVRMLKKRKQRHKKGSSKDARSDAGSGED